ncbi:MAG TPA: hypothetical protein VM782_22760 [Stellaceae bacterium]|nr:hypothetical protein [Stellaceae bacterium]
MRPNSLTAALVGAVLLVGCDWSQRVSGRIAPDSVGLADRCAEIMQRAMPFAQIDINDRTSRNADLRTIVAQVTGTRTDLAGNTLIDRSLGVECTFTDNILSGFRWTKGGPTPSS